MKTQIIIKADSDVKVKAQQTAAALGLPLSTLINAYLKQLIVTKEAHFSAFPKMTPKLERIVAKVRRDVKKGKNLSPVFDDTEKMLDYLHAQ